FNAERYAALRIPAPPLAQQRATADFLDTETAPIAELISEQVGFAAALRERRAAEINFALEGLSRRVPLASVSVRSGFFDGDWVESRDQDPTGNIRLLQLADV